MILNTMLSIVLQAPAAGPGGGIGTWIMFPLIIIVFYFFMIRPQSKKAKEQKVFRETIEKGSKIITIGGIHARIVDVKDTTFVIETGSGVKLEIEKTAVSVELTKAMEDAGKKAEEKKA